MGGRFRYSRTLGEFLPTKQINKSSPTNTFTMLEAYDLTKQFASGTYKYQDSFVSSDPITDYYTSTKKLVGWWRLGNNSDVNTITDSSGNSHDLVPRDNAADFDDGDTPSSFVSAGSLLFDDANSEGYKTNSTTSNSAFSFSDGSNDRPFSVSLWFKPTGTGDAPDYIVGKGTGGADVEWYIRHHHATEHLIFFLKQQTPTADTVKITSTANVFPVGVWHHIVVTYDGRGGSNADEGMNLYKNGVDVNPTKTGNADYKCMTPNPSEPFTIGSADGSYYTEGNITDVAIWKKALLPREAATLYGVSIAGAYRLVRDYSEKGTLAGENLGMPAVSQVGLDTVAAESDAFRQGINIVSLGHLTDYMQRKARPNAGFLMTLNGKDVPRNAFNDNLSPTSSPYVTAEDPDTPIASGSVKMNVSVAGRLGARVSHERELRDLGMSDLYSDNEPFYEPLLIVSGVFAPVSILKTHPLNRVMPTYMVDQTNQISMDGVIEPLPIRELIDGTSTEIPFHARGFRADLGGNIDSFRRSIIIDYGWNLNETGVTPFLDTVEMMGIPNTEDSKVLTGSITLQGIFYQGTSLISPFVDEKNDMQAFLSGTVTQDISDILASGSTTRRIDNTSIGGTVLTSSNVSNNSNKNFDIMGSRGFVFNNDSSHIDSIAYGGWKK